MNQDNFKTIRFFISEKSDGTMKLNSEKENQQFSDNRKKFFEKEKLDIFSTVSPNLVHGTKVEIVNENHKGQIISGTDGLITNSKGVVLTVTLADCVPVFFYDKKKSVIAIAHAGWKGVVQNISKSLVTKMINEFNSSPKDIVVYIGPHIKNCHFEVGEEVAIQFDKSCVLRSESKTIVDLSKQLKLQLISLKIPEKNISESDECTFCNTDKYFSYRRDKPKEVEAMIAYLTIV